MQDVTPEIVRAVNLAYHEEEAAAYDNRHPEIFKDELDHWESIVEEIVALKKARSRPIRVVDIGSGTGFVPLRLAAVLAPEDEMILTDLSPTMLEKARESLKVARFGAQASFLVSDAASLDLPAGSVDVVTMNSVLHHLPAPSEAFAALDRLLVPGGLMIVAHEPNARHFRHPIVGAIDRGIRLLRSLKSGKRGPATPNPFIDRVNGRLLATGVIRQPLSVEEVEAIVDIHSPTAGRKVDPARGFDPRGLASASFPSYAILRLETYRHLGKVDAGKRALLARLQGVLERLWSEAGALFLLILKKPGA